MKKIKALFKDFDAILTGSTKYTLTTTDYTEVPAADADIIKSRWGGIVEIVETSPEEKLEATEIKEADPIVEEVAPIIETPVVEEKVVEKKTKSKK